MLCNKLITKNEVLVGVHGYLQATSYHRSPKGRTTMISTAGIEVEAAKTLPFYLVFDVSYSMQS